MEILIVKNTLFGALVKNRFLILLTTLIASLLLASCGLGDGSHTGGGYNLAQMNQNLSGVPATFNTSGLCSGSLYVVNNAYYTTFTNVSGTGVLPASVIMYGHFGTNNTTSPCGPGNFGGLTVPPVTQIVTYNSLPSAAAVGSSGTYYTYTQTVNTPTGTQSYTGTVTWSLSSNNIFTLTDTNLTAAGASNYTMVRTFTISAQYAYTVVPATLTITVPAGTITGTITSTVMPSLNAQTAYQTFVINGWSDNNFTATGTCTGNSLTMGQTPLSTTSQQFNGGAVYPATFTQTGGLNGSSSFCSSASTPFNGTSLINYYNGSQVQAGNIIPSVYSSVNVLPGSLTSGPLHATQYTYVQSANSGSIYYSIATPATSSNQPILFTYEVNTNSAGTVFNYADITVSGINANNTLTPIAYSYSDANSNYINAYDANQLTLY